MTSSESAGHRPLAVHHEFRRARNAPRSPHQAPTRRVPRHTNAAAMTGRALRRTTTSVHLRVDAPTYTKCPCRPLARSQLVAIRSRRCALALLRRLTASTHSLTNHRDPLFLS